MWCFFSIFIFFNLIKDKLFRTFFVSFSMSTRTLASAPLTPLQLSKLESSEQARRIHYSYYCENAVTQCVLSVYFKVTEPSPLQDSFGVRQKGDLPGPTLRSPASRIHRCPGGLCRGSIARSGPSHGIRGFSVLSCASG